MNVGLVLEGGACKGIFTAGVMDYLMENKVYFPYVAGVSAGQCNALDYLSGQIGRTKDCMLPAEKRDGYYGFYSFSRTGRLFDIQKIFEEYPYKQFPFDFKTYFASPIVNEIVVTNCHTGRAEYLQEKCSKERLLKASMASSSMPFFTPMVKLDGEYYLDGGIADSIPFQRAFDSGCDKVVVIMTHNRHYRPRLSEVELMMCRKKYRNFPGIERAIENRPAMYLKQLAQMRRLEKDGKVFVLRPQVPAVGRLESDRDKMKAFFEHGYEYMKEQYDNLCAFMEAE